MKPGDTVVCVDNDWGELSLLKAYEISSISVDTCDPSYTLIGIVGHGKYFAKRFILLDSPVGLQALSQETKES